eukprot:TRINITY_DN5182_c0_g1_i2.p1 TRINITY_DN5182_c0_g1~~TRINITY_DN5182_c0_g1_i2.p1  ORF type:complete len:118 (+),score=7.91 TRINITY_DN5182_c0_g1_i2:749-1102(+)
MACLSNLTFIHGASTTKCDLRHSRRVQADERPAARAVPAHKNRLHMTCPVSDSHAETALLKHTSITATATEKRDVRRLPCRRMNDQLQTLYQDKAYGCAALATGVNLASNIKIQLQS